MNLDPLEEHQVLLTPGTISPAPGYSSVKVKAERICLLC